MLFFQLPEELKPSLPPIEEISKTDSNMGIDNAWVKVVLHSYCGYEKFNLPRVLWIRKEWKLKQLHYEVFKYFRDLFVRWLKEIKDTGSSQRSAQSPKYKKPGSKEALNYDSLMELIEKENLQT
jgi:hypothetical protein